MTEKMLANKELFTPVAIVIGALIIGGAIVYSKIPNLLQTDGNLETSTPAQTGTAKDTGTSPTTVLVERSDHVRGNFDAPLTLVEFSDFQCPFCSRFHPSAVQALAEYGDQIRWVYKHFPLDQIHPHARPAAEASECLAEQKGNDGFWEFADALFANQARLGLGLYQELAQQQGVNMAQFNDCVAKRKYQDKIESDYQLGVKLGVNGTPGSFLNGTPIRGAIPYEQLKAMIDEELSS